MCGRYSLTGPSADRLRERFQLGPQIALEPRFNIAPGTQVAAVTATREGRPHGDVLRWGLVPHWADSPKLGWKLINARAETVAERPAYRDAFAHRRCLIPADGFYEWQRRAHGPKLPWWITRTDHAPFAFAGLWELWRPAPEVEPLRTCTIITTEAHASLREVHGRMPVILAPEAEAAWLDPASDPDGLRELLVPFAATVRVPVGTAVNDATHDAPDCIDPIELPPDEPAAPALF
jgi:putative SOS response-associated peptidase YedK